MYMISNKKKSVDANGDGVLDLAEVAAALDINIDNTSGGVGGDGDNGGSGTAGVRGIAERMDVNVDGAVSYDEFDGFVEQLQLQQ